ncbi:MAG: Amuc_1100 family pilus-like protein [Candidatus Omnitrophota bacterium]|nr:Amuc_1100 family pilus-like protein [Candidatus Omnitrophota bacterium]
MILKRNLFSVTIIGILAAALLFAVGLFVFFMLQDAKIGKEIMTTSGTIDGFVKKSKMPLTENSVSFLEDERNKLKSAYSRLKLALTSPLGEEMPPEGMDSLQFKERLIQTQKKLCEEGKDFSLALPDSLGFTKYETELSDSAEIPHLLKRLKVLEELIYLMTLTGVASLDEISFVGEDIKKEEAPVLSVPALPDIGNEAGALPTLPPEPKKTKIYEEITVSFKITCSYSKLMDFLYRLKVSPFIFVVDDLDINKTKDALDKDQAAESMLQAAFLVKAELVN